MNGACSYLTRRRLLFHELQGRRIDAIAKAGRPWAVVEDMAQVRAASAAGDLGPPHSQGVVGLGFDGLFLNGLPITGPAGARVKFVLRTEQFLPAGDAHV